METDKVLLREEELPLFCAGDDYKFGLPIHPVLLREDIKLETDPAQIAVRAGLVSAKRHAYTRNRIERIGMLENGFMGEFFITGSCGMVIWENDGTYPDNGYPMPISFSPEKIRLYSTLEEGRRYLVPSKPPFGFDIRGARQHEAEFLRHFGVTYLNAALREVARKVA